VYVKIQSWIFPLIFGQKKGLSLSQLTKNRKSGYRSRRRCGITKVWTWESHPTVKLVNRQQFLKSFLCWAQVMNLTTEQCQIIEGGGIGSEFPIDFLWFATNKGLCGTNSDHVRMSHNKCKTVGLLQQHVTGSVEQFPSVEMEGLDIDFVWNGMSVSCQGNITSASVYHLDGRVSMASSIVAYGIQKETVAGRHWWCCDDFDICRHMPQAWIEKEMLYLVWTCTYMYLNCAYKCTTIRQRYTHDTPSNKWGCQESFPLRYGSSITMKPHKNSFYVEWLNWYVNYKIIEKVPWKKSEPKQTLNLWHAP